MRESRREERRREYNIKMNFFLFCKKTNYLIIYFNPRFIHPSWHFFQNNWLCKCAKSACSRVISVIQIERNEFQGRPRLESRHVMQNGVQNSRGTNGRMPWGIVEIGGTFFDPAVAFTNAIKFAAAAANFSNFRDNGTACRRAFACARGNFALIRLYYRRSNYWKVFARIKTEWQDSPSTVFLLRAQVNPSWNLNVSLLGTNCRSSGKLNFHIKALHDNYVFMHVSNYACIHVCVISDKIFN